ncbi:MAG: hypothetical protein ACP5IL_14540 [Syntrophobacteraceae bacterium]
MAKKVRFLALVLLALCLFGCSIWGHKSAGSPGTLPTVAEVANSPIRIKVVDVSNDTNQVFDVDAIGMLWNGIDDCLKEKGMLWIPQSEGQPYFMTCRIVSFKETGFIKRLMPYKGDTVLKVRVQISRGGKQVADFEVSRKIGYGKGMWTLHAWKDVFALVSKAIVKQAEAKL